jgi:putative phosphoribosyl transferase
VPELAPRRPCSRRPKRLTRSPRLSLAAGVRTLPPTLLIVGGADLGVIKLNEQALAELACEKRLEIVPGATHLFEEPGALEQVVMLAGDWLERHLRGQWNEVFRPS